ncbi:hypothetical protein B0H10DRAFT_2230378 [Mycena sp. CBHHK59/15]|nr:hypothetical protein B0H10DRAFT_2230378 [Mycena sp. CBHHK59/15]
MAPKSLKDYFYHGDAKNETMYHTYCKTCINTHLASLRTLATDLAESSQAFKGGKIYHLGPRKGSAPNRVERGHSGHESHVDAKSAQKDHKEHQAAKKRPRKDSDTASASDVPAPPPKKQHTQSTLSSLTLRRNKMPFGSAEKDALQGQALHAIVLLGSLFQLFEDPEMKVLFGMLHTMAPDILLMGKVVGGHLLNEAAEKVELNLKKMLRLMGWKKKKDSVNAICANVDFKTYLLELIDVTELKKDGPSQCKQFTGMIDRVEEKHGCIVIYFTTDADGGSKKGHVLLCKERPWLILLSCWAHQFQLILGDYFKVNDAAALIAEDATALIGWLNNHGRVQKICDESQCIISKDRNNGIIIVLAYLVAKLTRWTTHFIAFVCLFILHKALRLAVLQNRTAIIADEVGAATSKEGERLKEDAERMCTLIEDASFWNGLETVLGDLEPICLGTNINQKDSTHLDQVLLTITGIFPHFAEHLSQSRP